MSIFQWYLTIHNSDLHWNTCTLHQKNNPESQTFAWLAFSLSPCNVRFFTGRNFQRFMASSMSAWLKLILPAILLRCLLLPLQLYRSTDFEVHRTGELFRGSGWWTETCYAFKCGTVAGTTRFERAFLWRLTDDLEPMVHSNSTLHHSKAFQTKGNSAAQLYHLLWRPSWLPGRYQWGILRVEGQILWCFMSLMIQDLRTWRNWLAITYQLPISVAQPWKITSSDCLNLRRSGFDCLQPRARRLLTLK